MKVDWKIFNVTFSVIERELSPRLVSCSLSDTYRVVLHHLSLAVRDRVNGNGNQNQPSRVVRGERDTVFNSSQLIWFPNQELPFWHTFPTFWLFIGFEFNFNFDRFLKVYLYLKALSFCSLTFRTFHCGLFQSG